MTLTIHSRGHFHSASSANSQVAGNSEDVTLRLAPYTALAFQILSDHGLEVEDRQRLTLIVKAALEGRWHFFTAALHDPDQEELEQFFTDFVLGCVRRPPTRYQ
jgi:hypothetical protein